MGVTNVSDAKVIETFLPTQRLRALSAEPRAATHPQALNRLPIRKVGCGDVRLQRPDVYIKTWSGSMFVAGVIVGVIGSAGLVVEVYRSSDWWSNLGTKETSSISKRLDGNEAMTF